MQYKDIYGANWNGGLCLDHARLFSQLTQQKKACGYDPRMTHAFDEEYVENVTRLLTHAREQGDAYLVPAKDYKYVK